jgi:hypothetical protein
MATQRRPSDFKWNGRVSWLVVGLGLIGSAGGLVTGEYMWFVGGAVIALLALLVMRLSGRAKFGSRHIATLEGDIAPLGDQNEERGPEERVTVVEPPADDPPPPESAPHQE